MCVLYVFLSVYLSRNQHHMIAQIFTFLILLYISRTAESRDVKLCTEVDLRSVSQIIPVKVAWTRFCDPFNPLTYTK